MLNPTALRTAKTPWSFGRSECNRVKAISSMIELIFSEFLACFQNVQKRYCTTPSMSGSVGIASGVGVSKMVKLYVKLSFI